MADAPKEVPAVATSMLPVPVEAGAADVDTAKARIADVDDVETSSEILRNASGHTACRRLQFASSLAGPFAAMSAFNFGKDLYLLEFGASAEVMGTMLLVTSFITPMMDSAVGHLQDSSFFLNRCLPRSTWGRRAPWFFTHNLALAPLVFAFFVPPSYERTVLHWWFVALWLMGYWCMAACTNAFEAARVEIYPFKEERVNLEQFCKLTVAIGVGVGTGAAFLCLTYPRWWMFILASIGCCLAVLSGTIAVPVLREALSQGSQKATTAIQDFRSAMRSSLVVHMLVLRVLQGVHETIMPALQLYYYTFVFFLDKGPRLFYFVLGGAVLGIIELGLAPVWSRAFSRSSHLMLYLSLALRLLDVLLAPAMLMGVQDVRVFIVYLAVWRATNSSYSYWRVAACGWICDYEGGDREGMLLGLFTMVNNMGRTVCSAVVVLGLGWAGLTTVNCLGDEESEVRSQCEYDRLHNQPESLRQYLAFMLAIVAPAIELVICFLTFRFPIRPGSAMLAQLQRRQSESVSARRSGHARSPRPSAKASAEGSPATSPQTAAAAGDADAATSQVAGDVPPPTLPPADAAEAAEPRPAEANAGAKVDASTLSVTRAGSCPDRLPSKTSQVMAIGT